MDFVIMAGGLGSRFGGLKQIEPIDKHNNFIIDYTIFDAIRSGFDRIVIIINKNNYNIFKETIGKRVNQFVEVEYAFQENIFPNLRSKPLGTAHAVLSAKNVIKNNFVVVNADDFYGYESILKAYKNLQSLESDEHLMVAYEVQNTLSNFGAVKRGVCQTKEQYLEKVDECLIKKENDTIVAHKIYDENNLFNLPPETLVSMNLWGFNKSILGLLEQGFEEFCQDEDNIKNREYFLPGIIEKSIKKNKCKVKVLQTKSKWFGITYKEDKKEFVEKLNELIQSGEYPENLWKK